MLSPGKGELRCACSTSCSPPSRSPVSIQLIATGRAAISAAPRNRSSRTTSITIRVTATIVPIRTGAQSCVTRRREPSWSPMRVCRTGSMTASGLSPGGRHSWWWRRRSASLSPHCPRSPRSWRTVGRSTSTAMTFIIGPGPTWAATRWSTIPHRWRQRPKPLLVARRPVHLKPHHRARRRRWLLHPR